MRNVFNLTVMSSVLAAASAFSMSNATAATAVGLPFYYNDKLCGTYTDFVFDKSGNLKLNGDLTCMSGGDTGGGDTGGGDTGGGDTGGGDTGGGDTGGGDTGGGDTGGGDTGGNSQVCGNLPENLVSVFDLPWGQNISASVRAPIALSNQETYSLKINNPDSIKGYGYISTINTVNAIGTRSLVISECPGSLKPVADGGKGCEVVGSTEKQLKWSFDSKVPLGVTQCRLTPGKQYYINIKHEDQFGEASCAASKCYFMPNYTLQGVVK